MTTLTKRQLWSLERLGHLMLSAGRTDDARALFEGLTRIAADRSYAWYALAKIDALTEGSSRALDYATHALHLEANSRNRLLAAELNLSAGNQEAALSALDGIENLPESAERTRGVALRRRWFGR